VRWGEFVWPPDILQSKVYIFLEMAKSILHNAEKTKGHFFFVFKFCVAAAHFSSKITRISCYVKLSGN
jgi:hypothetical protein